MLDLRPEWLEIVRHLLAVHLPDAEVWAYGSRVQGTCHEGSDLDLVARNPAANSHGYRYQFINKVLFRVCPHS